MPRVVLNFNNKEYTITDSDLKAWENGNVSFKLLDKIQKPDVIKSKVEPENKE